MLHAPPGLSLAPVPWPGGSPSLEHAASESSAASVAGATRPSGERRNVKAKVKAEARPIDRDKYAR